MVKCISCGANEADNLSTCTQCGKPLGTSASASNGHGTVSHGTVFNETAMMPQITAPRAISSTSRINVISTADEGRFIPGTLIAGRYRIIDLLGRGGMGEVYRATDLTLAQSIAIKVLPEQAAANIRLLERFHNEVRIARQVSHPNVCRVYDIGEADRMPFLSMEYVDGEDLASLLQRIGRLPSDKALEISRKLCAGLAAAHERGVMHRDLKPNNVMLDKRGQVVIMDFGLAAVADELSGPEARHGTPAYMAPEQLRGDSVTNKSDIYALGLIIYELFTGHRPFDATGIPGLLTQQLANRPVSMISLAADIDPAVERAVHRCLQPNPIDRPSSVLAVAAALPGGDPLAAALAAGETPSPEMVAASGKIEGFPLHYAIPCLAFCLLTLLCLPLLKQPMSLIAITPMDFTPPVLEQRARDIATAFGYTEKPTDFVSWLSWDNELVTYLKGQSVASHDWRREVAAAPPVQFNYRQSADYLASSPDGMITANRPAPTQPGMFTVMTDSRARLLHFLAIPPRFDVEGPDLNLALDPVPVFRAAGLDLSTFHEVTPLFVPPTAFDSRHAWMGPYPGLTGTSIVLELACYRGKPTSFSLRWPWNKPVNQAPQAPTLSTIGFEIFSALFITTGILSALIVARRNLQAGRGDRQGAFRLAFFQFGLFIVVCIPTFHVIPRTDMLGYVVQNLSFGLAMAVLLWVMYIAVEPAVRARWPHSLITWNRLLAGQIGDPRLGSHILLGIALGIALRLVFTLITLSHGLLGSSGPTQMANLDVLYGTGALTNVIANSLWNSILIGLFIFLILSGLRALLRFEWLAAIATALILTVQENDLRNSNRLWLDLPAYMLLYGSFTFVLLRMGLVPIILAYMVVIVTGSIPYGTEFSAWYNYITVLALGFLGLLAIYGFWRSQSVKQA